MTEEVKTMRTNWMPVAFGVLLSLCLVTGVVSPVHASSAKAEGYASLKGVRNVKAVFDFRISDPKSAALHLDVMGQTYKDKALQPGKKKPVVVVVFSGGSVKLLSTKREGIKPEEAKLLDDIAGKLAAMAKDGIRLEVCQIALKVFGIDSASVLPELNKVGNGYVSLIGYGAQGFTQVPVF